MKNIQTIFKNNLFSAFSFKQYLMFSLWFRIILIIFMTPVLVLTLLLGAWYQIAIFIFKLIQVPSKYIKETIDENQVSSAPLFVVYLIAYPVKFYFDLFVAINMIYLSILHFLFVSLVYISSLGGTTFQPYLFEADGHVETSKPTNRVSPILEIVITSVLVLVITLLVFVPKITSSIRATNERLDLVADRTSDYLIEKNFDENYTIIESYYFSDDNKPDYAIVRIKFNGLDYFIQVYESGVYQTQQLTSLSYSSLKTSSTHDNRYTISASKLEDLIDQELD